MLKFPAVADWVSCGLVFCLTPGSQQVNDNSTLSCVGGVSAGTAAILHSSTLAQLTKGMNLARKNEEAAANLQESQEAAASLQRIKRIESTGI